MLAEIKQHEKVEQWFKRNETSPSQPGEVTTRVPKVNDVRVSAVRHKKNFQMPKTQSQQRPKIMGSPKSQRPPTQHP